jgi:hypothetical protein
MPGNPFTSRVFVPIGETLSTQQKENGGNEPPF